MTQLKSLINLYIREITANLTFMGAVRTLAEKPISPAKKFGVHLSPYKQIKPRRLPFAFFPNSFHLHTIRHNITVSDTTGVDT
jgi:hypothetical protein